MYSITFFWLKKIRLRFLQTVLAQFIQESFAHPIGGVSHSTANIMCWEMWELIRKVGLFCLSVSGAGLILLPLTSPLRSPFVGEYHLILCFHSRKGFSCLLLTSFLYFFFPRAAPLKWYLLISALADEACVSQSWRQSDAHLGGCSAWSTHPF